MSENILQWLERYVAIYRRLPRPEPPPQWDAAVLAQAQKALRPPTRAPRWPRWFATAAALSLAIGLGWHLNRESTPGYPPAPAPGADGAQPGQSARARQAAPTDAARDANEKKDAAAHAPESAAGPGAAPEEGLSRRQESEPSVQAPVVSTPSKSLEAPPAAPPPPARVDAPAPAANEAAAGASASKTEQDAASVMAEPTLEERADAALPTPEPQADHAARAAMRPKPEPAPFANNQGKTDGDPVPPPEAWIARIEEQLQRGQTEDAVQDLKRFRTAYPKFPLPKHLEDLLH